jgi:peptide/nickel transport system substrate-binding protein
MVTRVLFLALLTSLLAACAAPTAPRSTGSEASGSAAERTTAPKRITIAIRSDPKALSAKLNSAGGAGGAPGAGEIEMMLNNGLAVETNAGAIHAQLAEAVPSVDNGLWKVFPDGRMETTWHLRSGIEWHDGVPFTADDVLFTAKVEQDRDLPIFRNVAYSNVDSVEAPDPQTVTIHWKRPFIQADRMFTNSLSMPMPRHLLEATYQDDKENLQNLAYWSRDFVGTGAYKLREFTPGTGVVLDANDRYVLGRPRIDQITVRFILDPSTMAANILAGDVDMNMGGRLAIEWGTQIAAQWRDGRMFPEVARSMVTAYPQFINPNPPVLLDLQFRRALMHAVDRQQLLDSLNGGYGMLGDAIISPSQAEWKDVESSVVRYPYDPARTAQLIQGLGYTRGADGIYRDAAGQRLAVEVRTTSNDDVQMKTMASTADYWQQAGVGVDQVAVPPQRSQDREYRATRPAFEIVRQPNGVKELSRLYGGNTPLPENDYTGVNRSRHRNPEFDALIDRFLVTIPQTERMGILRDIVHYVSDQLIIMGMFWDPGPTMIANRIKNVGEPGDVYDVYQWDVDR